MMASMILSLNLLNEKQTFNRLNLKICLVLSLFFASLPILKSTYAIFPIIYFLLFIIFFIFMKNSYKYKISVIVSIPIFSFVFFIPWTLFLIDLYREIPLTTNQTLNINLPWVKPAFRVFFLLMNCFMEVLTKLYIFIDYILIVSFSNFV